MEYSQWLTEEIWPTRSTPTSIVSHGQPHWEVNMCLAPYHTNNPRRLFYEVHKGDFIFLGKCIKINQSEPIELKM